MKKYDVVIIGAGISGLVAGNYLAKAGLKTLIIERHYSAGGCCSYFQRKGYLFDCGAHSLGSCREDGQFGRVFRELGLDDKLNIKRANPSDTVIVNDKSINFGGDADQICDSLSNEYPQYSKQLREFLSEIDRFDINNPRTYLSYYRRYKNTSFDQMLISFGLSPELKETFSVFLGNIGLPSDLVGALPAITMFKEFVFDGGYYLEGGMKEFIGQLLKNYLGMGGEYIGRTSMSKIGTKNKKVIGVYASNENFYQTDTVVSTISPFQTFSRLIDSEENMSNSLNGCMSLKKSVSAFIMYLGVSDMNLSEKKSQAPRVKTF